MKKFAIALLLFTSLTATLHAQSWKDALKGAASGLIDEATGGKLTEVAIVGTWKYSAPAIRLGGDSTVASIGGAALGNMLGTKMSSAFEKIGVKPGFCSITLNSDGTFSMPVKGKVVKGNYTFEPSTHVITLNIGMLGLASIKGMAYINGSSLQLVFAMDKFTDFFVALGSKVSALSSITSLVKQFDNAMLGMEFEK